MKRAPGHALVGSFGGGIDCGNGLDYAGMKGRAVLGVKLKYPHVGY